MQVMRTREQTCRKGGKAFTIKLIIKSFEPALCITESETEVSDFTHRQQICYNYVLRQTLKQFILAIYFKLTSYFYNTSETGIDKLACGICNNTALETQQTRHWCFRTNNNNLRNTWSFIASSSDALYSAQKCAESGEDCQWLLPLSLQTQPLVGLTNTISLPTSISRVFL